MRTPNYLMLVGLPGVGKSTWRSWQLSCMSRYEQELVMNTVVLSSDDIIEDLCDSSGLTYSEGFKQFAGAAGKTVHENMLSALKVGYDIIDDRTNLTLKGRKSKLDVIPEGYTKTAIVFDPPPVFQWLRQMDRPGKSIPIGALIGMAKSYTVPTLDEGFDEIIFDHENQIRVTR